MLFHRISENNHWILETKFGTFCLFLQILVSLSSNFIFIANENLEINHCYNLTFNISAIPSEWLNNIAIIYINAWKKKTFLCNLHSNVWNNKGSWPVPILWVYKKSIIQTFLYCGIQNSSVTKLN